MNNTTTKTKFSFASRIGAWWAKEREASRRLALRRRCPPATVAAEQISPAVRSAWAHHAPDEFPGLAVDDGAWLRCSLALAQFFEASRLQQAACALPSKAADSVWHVWLQLDPAGLVDWQQRYFDRVVEHREADALGVPVEEGLAHTWVGACRSEGLNLLGPKLPLVFAVDGLVGLPTGWAYRHERGTLVHRQIDGFGRPSGPAVGHAAVAGAGLVALGLLSEAEFRTLRQRQSDSSSDSGSSSTSDGSSDSSCDASSDAGCSCGSSCGSSCGGGGD